MDGVALFIGIASGRDAKWPFPRRLADLFWYLGCNLPSGSRLELCPLLTYDTAQARRKLVTNAKEWGASHILFIDDDMDFPHDGAARLLAAQKPVVAANYTTRGLPVVPLSMTSGKRIYSVGKNWLERVDRAPTGFMLIEMGVFGKIAKPYFNAPPVNDDSDDGVSDDYYFCDKARAAGVEIWIDHHVSNAVRHIGAMAYDHRATSPPDDVLSERMKQVLR